MEETHRLQAERHEEDEQLRGQQYKEHQGELRDMHERHLEQMTAMREVLKDQEAASPHLKIAPYQDNEDIQDFLEAFEGIINIQKIATNSWVLRLTPLLSGRARTVCTDLGSASTYEEVKLEILKHYNVNVERCRKQFRAHRWTKD